MRLLLEVLTLTSIAPLVWFAGRRFEYVRLRAELEENPVYCSACKSREKQAILFFRVHAFCIKLSTHKWRIFQAMSAAAIQVLMGFVFVTKIQEGEKLWQRKSVQTVTPQSEKPRQSVPPVESN